MKAWSGMPDESVRERRTSGPDVRFDIGGYRGSDAIKVETHNKDALRRLQRITQGWKAAGIHSIQKTATSKG
ncbi:MAG: hypothetical protein ACJ8EK_14995 [Bradyrhizobium sp.]|jgi:hypothetical protein